MLTKRCLFIVVTCVAMAVQSAAADERRAEMWEEPSHQLVFERQNTRVLDIRVVPGVTSEFHSHRFATVYVVIQDALLQGQEFGQSWSDRVERPYRSSGELMDRADYVERNSYHRVRNNDSRTFHLVSVVNSAAPALDAADKSLHDGLLDNRWFAEHRIRLAPGETSGMLSFANNSLLVQVDKGQSYVLQNGVTHSVQSMPGAWSFHAGGSRFQVVNDSLAALAFVLLEVRD